MPLTDRLTVLIDPQDNRSLMAARVGDGIPTTERLRAAVHLWHTDPELRERIDAAAADLRRRRLAERPGRADQVKAELVLGPELHQALSYARAVDRIPATERIRAVVQLWQTDPVLRGHIDAAAAGRRQSRRRPAQTA